jgi:hypothetical protein
MKNPPDKRLDLEDFDVQVNAARASMERRHYAAARAELRGAMLAIDSAERKDEPRIALAAAVSDLKENRSMYAIWRIVDWFEPGVVSPNESPFALGAPLTRILGRDATRMELNKLADELIRVAEARLGDG